ncbi:MAG: DUF6600 domain-containing protein [Ignavibacteriaceae bacterium]
MKKVIYTVLTFTVLFVPACTTTQNVAVVNHPNPTFNQLDNYGEWIQDPGLGTVWRPHSEQQWQPYANGHWVWTDNGWMWDSYEPYGWMVYHYGYWNYDDQLGWVWVPSYDWSPARVVWYNQDGYVGWAPQPSPNFPVAQVYNNINITNVWVVVPQKNFINNNVVQYRTRGNNVDIRNIRNNNGDRAPNVRVIENATNRRIDVTNIVNEKISAGNRQLIRARVQGEGNNRNDQFRNSGGQRNNQEVKPPTVTKPVNPPLRSPANPNPQKDNIKPVERNQPIDNNKNIRDSNPKRINNLIRQERNQNLNKSKIEPKKQSPVKQKKAPQVKSNLRRDSVNVRRENIRR